MVNHENATLASTRQMLELGSSIVKNLPKDMPEDIAVGWIGNPKGLAKVIAEALMLPQTSRQASGLEILTIDHSTPFDPTSFIGEGWSIWRGPADGNGLEGDKDQDPRSLALTELDLGSVRFKTTLKSRETSVNGEEKLRRLKAMDERLIRLDAKAFQTCWEHREELPESWKQDENGNVRYIYFDGTVLRHPRGRRYVLCLCFRDGWWNWGYEGLGNDWDSQNPSAVLANSSVL